MGIDLPLPSCACLRFAGAVVAYIASLGVPLIGHEVWISTGRKCSCSVRVGHEFIISHAAGDRRCRALSPSSAVTRPRTDFYWPLSMAVSGDLLKLAGGTDALADIEHPCHCCVLGISRLVPTAEQRQASA